MNETLKIALTDLKEAVIDLQPEGQEGFEGLMAVVLGAISGIGFRVASAGSQHGKDGEAITRTNHIAFEAKLYTGTINPNEVLSKIPKINEMAKDTLDLWVLGATIPISLNLSKTVFDQANANGFPVLVLDWPDTAFPPLAAALALAADTTANFLEAQLGDSAKAHKARAAFTAISADPEFGAAAARIERELSDASLGLAIALPANRAWLAKAFNSREEARIAFGQPLAPGEQQHHPTLDRADLVKKVEERVFQSVGGDVVGLIGDEGCGKSWLFAQAWLRSNERPLTLVVTPGDLREPIAYESAESVLIAKLIQQTGGDPSSASPKRWARRFNAWRENLPVTSPRLVVFADGLNQRSDFNWPRWLSATAAILDEIGGKLVFTTREQHFRESLKPALSRNVQQIRVPEWSLPELDSVLAEKGISRSILSPAVVNSLRNPRLLGIAYELLNTAQIANFQELSVSRLMFEHIRISTRDGNAAETPAMFAQRLAKHANEVLERRAAQRRDDLLVFERAELSGTPHALTSQLQAVAGKNFFSPVQGNDALYSLTEDGLVYALALSVIHALQQADRNNRNLPDRLVEIVEPISALDKTADVLLAALVIAGVDEGCPASVTTALIGAYVSLQNIETKNYDVFAPVTRTATDAAMTALFELCVSGRHVANKEWLLSALRQQRDEPKCWEIIAGRVKEWLGIYSLAATLGARDRHSGLPADAIAKDVEDRKTKLEEKTKNLTAEETRFMATKLTRRDEIDTSVLAEDVFVLMAGMPLADFAESFVAWCFSQSLNATFRTPFDEFQFLVRFNRKDWALTRTRLLEESSFLAGPSASRVGKWALVYVLRAVGSDKDALQEEGIVADLTKDHPPFRGWRQIEKYCDTDPCDPASPNPSNIDATATKYLAIKMSALRQGLGMTAEDSFLEEARPGLVRFRSDAAVTVQRNVADDVLGRTGFQYRQGVLGLEEHTVLLTSDQVERFTARAVELCVPFSKEDRDARDSWISSQYTLLLILPHLSGDDQLNLLATLPPHGPSLLKLSDVMTPASPENLERRLNVALQASDPHTLSLVLSFARFSSTPLSPRVREIIKRLAQSADKKERAFALGVIDAAKDEELVAAVAEGGWSASLLDPRDDYYEIWYGSSILIQAAKLGLLQPENMLDRIAPRRFGTAASVLGDVVYRPIALRLGAVIAKALEIEVPFQPPVVEEHLSASEQLQLTPPLKSLVESDTTNDPQAAFKRFQERPEEFEARQRQGWESFNQFEAFLTRESARVIVEEVSTPAIQASFSATPGVVQSWADKILALDDARLPVIHNAGLVIARVISADDPQKAAKLFKRLAASKPFVRFTYGVAATTLDARSIWKSADRPELDTLKAQRLDRAVTDQGLAQETLTALDAGRSALLKAYIDERIESAEPAIVARALVVCGFCDVSPHAESILARFVAAKGIVGKAVTAAQLAYERNKWSRHWFGKLCSDALPEEFWRHSALLLKIVDGRIDLWSEEFTGRGNLMERFGSSLQGDIEKRIKRWRTKRERTFLGDKVPQPIFVIES